MAATILNPIINGHRFSWASIEVVINGLQIAALRSINYTSELTPGVIYGNDPSKRGRTPGKVNHSCVFEILLREWMVLRDSLGQSYGRRSFNIVVQYAEPKQDTTQNVGFSSPGTLIAPPIVFTPSSNQSSFEGVATDTIIGCRITNVEHPNTDDTAATVVHITCDVLDIREGSSALAIEQPDADQPVDPFVTV